LPKLKPFFEKKCKSLFNTLSPTFLFRGILKSGFSFTTTKFSFIPTSIYINCSDPRYSENLVYPVNEDLPLSQIKIFSGLIPILLTSFSFVFTL